MANIDRSSDEELFSRMSSADHKEMSFHVLYECYQSAMLIYAAKRVPLPIAEDLVHDVFVRIWNNRYDILIGDQFTDNGSTTLCQC